jgi:hypothetical protein
LQSIEAGLEGSMRDSLRNKVRPDPKKLRAEAERLIASGSWTKSRIAKDTKLTFATVSAFLEGKGRTPNDGTLAKIQKLVAQANSNDQDHINEQMYGFVCDSLGISYPIDDRIIDSFIGDYIFYRRYYPSMDVHVSELTISKPIHSDVVLFRQTQKIIDHLSIFEEEKDATISISGHVFIVGRVMFMLGFSDRSIRQVIFNLPDEDSRKMALSGVMSAVSHGERHPFAARVAMMAKPDVDFNLPDWNKRMPLLRDLSIDDASKYLEPGLHKPDSMSKVLTYLDGADDVGVLSAGGLVFRR